MSRSGSSRVDRRTPVIVGVGQTVNRGEEIVEPLDLMEQATLAAADDTGKGARVLARVQSVQVVNVLAGTDADPAGELARRLGIPDGDRLTTTIGGNTPQWLVNRACDQIVSGDLDAILVVGAEALASRRRARARDESRAAPQLAGRVIGDARNGVGPAESAAGVVAPAQLYPWFESALAYRAGRTPDAQRDFLGRLMAPFTHVAAKNAYAWFPEIATPEELSTVGPSNRLVGEPYTKRMNAMIQVDQGAALLVMSAAAARAARVPPERWVFPWAGADLHEVFFPVERPHLFAAPALRAAAAAAMDAAGLGVDDIDMFDLYSCFPCAVQMAAAALGLDPFDPRGMTVTGGHPYFGGPGNNYVTHAIAETVVRCRADAGAVGLVTGLGWYVTKHSVGVYSAEPPVGGWRHPELRSEQLAIDATALPLAGSGASGPAIVDAMTVLHDREAGPVAAPVVATLSDGFRVAAVPADPSLPRALSSMSLVGASIDIRPGPPGGAPRYDPR